jgi:hypothetical protein
MKKVFIAVWTALCVLPLLFPSYMLFVYKDPGAANFGWEMFLGFGLFWGSVALALLLCIANAILVLRRPEVLVNTRVGVVYLGLNLITLVLAGAVFYCG